MDAAYSTINAHGKISIGTKSLIKTALGRASLRVLSSMNRTQVSVIHSIPAPIKESSQLIPSRNRMPPSAARMNPSIGAKKSAEGKRLTCALHQSTALCSRIKYTTGSPARPAAKGGAKTFANTAKARGSTREQLERDLRRALRSGGGGARTRFESTSSRALVESQESFGDSGTRRSSGTSSEVPTTTSRTLSRSARF